MKESIEQKIIESLAKDMALEDMEEAARKVRILHVEMVQTLASFVRLCAILEDFRQDYGEEVYQASLDALGLKMDQVEYVIKQITGLASMPDTGYQQTLYEIAWSTMKQIKLIGGNNGNTLR